MVTMFKPSVAQHPTKIAVFPGPIVRALGLQYFDTPVKVVNRLEIETS